jgi:hypothetical protein
MSSSYYRTKLGTGQRTKLKEESLDIDHCFPCLSLFFPTRPKIARAHYSTEPVGEI